ncbi:MAG: M55 family metallopeptidase [Chloroflexi bacterium]|nr:M55 family metallopeptidase [Chloroflexota bacterium]
MSIKVFIETDMEGVAGILDHDDWCQPAGGQYRGRYYDLGRAFLTREVNAAIDGLFEAGADEVVVSDGHGAGGINPALLDRRAWLLRSSVGGWPGGLDRSFSAVIWIGQHAKAGTQLAHLAHTQWFNYLDQTINNVSIGELGEMALCAGELGVPCIYASGDMALVREAQALIPGIITTAVKHGLNPDHGALLTTEQYMRANLSAIHRQPEKAREMIYEGARAALTKLKAQPQGWGLATLQPPYERVTRFRPDKPGDPYRIDIARHATSVIGVMNAAWRPEPYQP